MKTGGRWMTNKTLLRLTIGAWALMQACISAQAACTSANTYNITVAVTPTVTNTFATITSDFALVYSANYTPVTPVTCYTVSLISATADTIAGTVAAASVAGGNTSSTYDVFIAEAPKVPAQLAGKYSGLLSGALPFWVATDTLDLYSTSVDISGGLPLFPTAFSVPNPATLDTYGRATVEALKGGWVRALVKGLPITTDDAFSSWSAVEYGFGNPAYGFTGKSQICTNIGNGGESYEDGSFHHEYVYGKDYVTALAWTGLKLNQLSNGAIVTRSTQAEAAVNAFISFLSQASVTVTDNTPGGSGGTVTLDGGKTGLAQSCLKTTR
jgi:molybdate transport system substrate-binding protein